LTVNLELINRGFSTLRNPREVYVVLIDMDGSAFGGHGPPYNYASLRRYSVGRAVPTNGAGTHPGTRLGQITPS